MVPQQRRPPPSSAQDYYAVPQSPQGSSMQGSQAQYAPNMPPVRQPSAGSQMQSGRGAIAQGVASGVIGGGYGPYSYNPSTARDNLIHNPSRFSAAPSEVSSLTGEKPAGPVVGGSSSVPPYLWDTRDPDLDDALHNPDPLQDAALDSSFTFFSARGWANASALFILVVGLILLFAGYPIIHYYTQAGGSNYGYNLGNVNYTGQVPDGMPGLLDVDTPQSAYTKTINGYTYRLAFSDEFNTNGRTFWPGDDAYWEAQNLHYWPTGDLEWYDPQAITTKDGNLVITVTEQPINNLNFMSGMLTSWNKFCFTTGYIEVNMSQPGAPTAPGFWPGVWTMGNLGKAGYGGTTDGTWPYSYDSCDVGTFPNQTAKDGTPTVAATGGLGGGPLSYQPGQRLSSCTCPGSDHPGPNVNVGRGVPEIDILETETNVWANFQGEVSQSFQTAPYNYQYQYYNTSPDTTIYGTGTTLNAYTGGVYQQACSALTPISSENYGGKGFATYGFDWWSNPSNRDSGYITWYSEGQPSWQLTAASLGPDPTVGISARLIPEEPMYVILNLGLAPSFQPQDFMHLVFPSEMLVDYVRVYQREGIQNGVTCDPPNYPTATYINDHLEVYTNPNITTWAQGGQTTPRNSLYDGC
ncbi:glycoside hydrolase family 16 protein [Hygrophoropsis aurantiaca]|uniref:Glycoside hydrolase family 16 protein n=1 Tax=Hygrophoropsis aurantiaca TaxID=72124 RepID=A0ACB8ALX1_9AGAM|nr:glycoside hydrolase family 16 protein [Hygrophoropsis aurantiaca]